MTRMTRMEMRLLMSRALVAAEVTRRAPFEWRACRLLTSTLRSSATEDGSAATVRGPTDCKFSYALTLQRFNASTLAAAALPLRVMRGGLTA
jgi:hypothetical protein